MSYGRTSNVVAQPQRPKQIFLHFFDVHFLEDKGIATTNQAFHREMVLATRLAVASADCVLVPAASYLESNICRNILEDLDELVQWGLIKLVGSSVNIEEFIRERQDESFYPSGSAQHSHYRQKIKNNPLPAYHRRYRSTTKDIIQQWGRNVQDESLQRMLRDAIGGVVPNLESRLERVPTELGGLAFIPEHVFKILDINPSESLVAARIRSSINKAYFDSYLRELEAGVVDDLNYLASDFKMPSYGQNISYAKMLRFLIADGTITSFLECHPANLIALGRQASWIQALQASLIHISPPSIPPPIFTTSAPKILMSKKTEPFKVLCIASAPSELQAIQGKFKESFGPGNNMPVSPGANRYVQQYIDSEFDISWNLASLHFQGQVEAASAIPQIIQKIKPDLTLMIGMCMGMPKREYAVGTVIVPNEVMSFDHSRINARSTQYRPHGKRVTQSALYSLARLLDTSELKYKVVADKGLASANAKVEKSDSKLIKFIENSFPDAAAYDMEGNGFYSMEPEYDCLWIKAVADSGEPQDTSAKAQQEKQGIQVDATNTATDFAIRLVREHQSSRSPKT